jgi:CRISPR-associated protein Cas1
MVNEFVYCPRLFHLEWVQGRFATSDDVEEGLYVHRVVDDPPATCLHPTTTWNASPDAHLAVSGSRHRPSGSARRSTLSRSAPMAR